VKFLFGAVISSARQHSHSEACMGQRGLKLEDVYINDETWKMKFNVVVFDPLLFSAGV
jgi:hypothetical protein